MAVNRQNHQSDSRKDKYRPIWAVLVKYGRRGLCPFASNVSYESATKLSVIAKEKGYKNPVIMTVREYEIMVEQIAIQKEAHEERRRQQWYEESLYQKRVAKQLG